MDWFALLCSEIGPENSCLFVNKTDATQKPITTCSRAFGSLVILCLSSHWLLKVFSFLFVGRWDYFDYGLTTLTRSASYENSIVGRICGADRLRLKYLEICLRRCSTKNASPFQAT